MPIRKPKPTSPGRRFITFPDFLRCSSNQFAAELLVRSLQQSAGRHEIAVRGRVSSALLESSALADGIASLYDDADVVAKRIPGRTTRIWPKKYAPQRKACRTCTTKKAFRTRTSWN